MKKLIIQNLILKSSYLGQPSSPLKNTDLQIGSYNSLVMKSLRVSKAEFNS